MAFLTVSDQSGEMEVVVFPNVLKIILPSSRRENYFNSRKN